MAEIAVAKQHSDLFEYELTVVHSTHTLLDRLITTATHLCSGEEI